MARAARVLRLARLPLRPNRSAELQRIFGGDVQVFDTTLEHPESLRDLAGSLGVDAIVLDVVLPRAVRRLHEGLGHYPLLRPTWVDTHTSRGELQPRFAGYRLLGSDGTLRAIDNAALAPED